MYAATMPPSRRPPKPRRRADRQVTVPEGHPARRGDRPEWKTSNSARGITGAAYRPPRRQRRGLAAPALGQAPVRRRAAALRRSRAVDHRLLVDLVLSSSRWPAPRPARTGGPHSRRRGRRAGADGDRPAGGRAATLAPARGPWGRAAAGRPTRTGRPAGRRRRLVAVLALGRQLVGVLDRLDQRVDRLLVVGVDEQLRRRPQPRAILPRRRRRPRVASRSSSHSDMSYATWSSSASSGSGRRRPRRAPRRCRGCPRPPRRPSATSGALPCHPWGMPGHLAQASRDQPRARVVAPVVEVEATPRPRGRRRRPRRLAGGHLGTSAPSARGRRVEQSPGSPEMVVPGRRPSPVGGWKAAHGPIQPGPVPPPPPGGGHD